MSLPAGALAGDEFLFGDEAEIEPLWADGNERVLWSGGEPLIVYGPAGVGKNTLLGHLMLARLGIEGDVLGFPVLPAEGRTLYLALDRPRQAARSLRRMVNESGDTTLHERFIVWPGRLPFDASKHPEHFVEWVAEKFEDVSDIYVDSLKDLGIKDFSKPEAGEVIGEIMRSTTLAGYEFVGLHHPRKAQGDNKTPNAIDDMYGGGQLAWGAGSVICLWGEAGSGEAQLLHLKQPAERLGPYTLRYDYPRGEVWIDSEFEVRDKREEAKYRAVKKLALDGREFITVREVIDAGVVKDDKTARKHLATLVGQRYLVEESGGSGRATRWYAVHNEGRD